MILIVDDKPENIYYLKILIFRKQNYQLQNVKKKKH